MSKRAGCVAKAIISGDEPRGQRPRQNNESGLRSTQSLPEHRLKMFCLFRICGAIRSDSTEGKVIISEPLQKLANIMNQV